MGGFFNGAAVLRRAGQGDIRGDVRGDVRGATACRPLGNMCAAAHQRSRYSHKFK
eukprot:CAMPEP_0119334896 /NCGR_PEP_ID=MMETSP1333-20130426/88278_1 /TAXON_ID=418940 /ORGANISM="Scyphosphaera apsteinii, Strain RCC1455" /LENGTH=54 /DNA_ID=CAMNT_0007345309 /DNA_START=293 /DNA_END=454 /DNA_ORIENTATION=-